MTEQDAIIAKLEADLEEQSKTWRVCGEKFVLFLSGFQILLLQLVFSIICACTSLLLASVWVLKPGFVCATFGAAACTMLGPHTQSYLFGGLVLSFILQSIAFTGSAPSDAEKALWFAAFALSSAASIFLLSALQSSDSDIAGIVGGLLPVVVALLCGYVLNDVRRSFAPEIAQLKASKYRHKSL